MPPSRWPSFRSRASVATFRTRATTSCSRCCGARSTTGMPDTPRGAPRRRRPAARDPDGGFPMRTDLRALRRLQASGEPFPVVTAYDYTAALLADRAGIPMILVGDSMAQGMLGYEDTLPVTVDDVVHHTAAVTRGARQAFVVADMPFMSYQASVEDALRNAGRLLKEGGAQAVKLEGGRPVLDTVRALTGAGIATMGHLGLTPQSVHSLGGYAVQARSSDAARSLLEDALALQAAGAFAVVLELVPAELAAEVTEALDVPTIGIGAGPACDAQVQVWHDLL